jgi:hypothetical protein
MGLDGQDKPLSDGGESGGATLRKMEEEGTVQRCRRSPRSSKWRSKRSSRSGDGGAVNADDNSRVDGIGKG